MLMEPALAEHWGVVISVLLKQMLFLTYTKKHQAPNIGLF